MQKPGTEIPLAAVAGLRLRLFNPCTGLFNHSTSLTCDLLINKISLMIKHVKCASELGQKRVSVNDTLDQLCYCRRMEYYTAIKRDTLQPGATAEGNHTTITQRENNKAHYIIVHKWNSIYI